MRSRLKSQTAPQSLLTATSSRSLQYPVTPQHGTAIDRPPILHEALNLSVPSTNHRLIQPKLMIGAVGDKYEQEADRVAAQVVDRINAPQASQPKETTQHQPTDEEDDRLQMKPRLQSPSAGMPATPELEAGIGRSRGHGTPLTEAIRKPMEQVFNADFSHVKVHTDAQADQLNQSIHARAFTTKQDIYFRQGAYQPNSRTGQEVIAHELTHVVQQSGTVVQQKRGHRNLHSQSLKQQAHRKGIELANPKKSINPLEGVVQCYDDVPSRRSWKWDTSMLGYKRSAELDAIDNAVKGWDDVAGSGDRLAQRQALQTILYSIGYWRNAKAKKYTNSNSNQSRRDDKITELENAVIAKQGQIADLIRLPLTYQAITFEDAVNNGTFARIRTRARVLNDKDPEYFRELLKKSMTASAGTVDKWMKYYFTAPINTYGQGDLTPAALATKNSYGWMTTPIADDIITNFLTPLKDQPGNRAVVQLFQIANFLIALETHATPAVFNKLVNETPQLAVLYNARDRVKRTKGAAAVTTDVLSIADQVFAGFIGATGISARDRGIKAIYSATTPGVNPIEMRKHRSVKAEAACHDLVAILENIFQTWTGTTPTIGHGYIDPPVLTHNLSTIPRTHEGLIHSTFPGNVFTDTGGGYVAAGRIFFTAQPRSHTWLTVNGKAYDVLFGTTAAQVPTVPDEEFSPQPGNDDVYVGRSTGRRLIRTPALYDPSRAYNFGSGYILEPPSR
ncbi:DUF4157 domain-containing protein [Leptolyngbya sp. PL-A3]|uniref:eCIS core domain-containing protein n=1 Tax=Leptolyngbya sp. PL-A3 TaxID=2933911 RepID=UPI003297D7E4